VTSADRPLRVLWVIKGLGPGGAERLLVEHARASAGTDIEFEAAFVLDWKQHLVPELERAGVRTRSLGVAREYDPRWAVRLCSLLRRERYDVVHAHSPLVAAVTRVAVRSMPRRIRPACIYTEHNRWPSYRTVTRIANQATYRFDDVTFAVSNDVRESIPPSARTKVEVVVHGVDTDAVRAELAERDAVRAELGLAPGESLAVTVANLRHGKNYPGLIAAAELVVARGVPIRFAAAGQGPLEGEIRELLARSSSSDRFALLGYRTDATRLIAGADLFVLASHHEGLPVTVMEALTLGVPVVAPAVGGLREVVDDGANGFLVTPGAPQALADAIVRAIEPAEHQRLVAGARTTGDRFSSRDAVALVNARYVSAAGSPASPRPR
jgi:glycosyltransferase involved in cell wall biosynthesis